MNIAQLQQEFANKGWTFGAPMNIDTGVSWNVYKRTNGADCACNDKPPSITVTPYDLRIHGLTFQSVEFSITGELPNGMWFNSEIYGIKYDDVMLQLDNITTILTKAWNNACSV